MLGWGSVGPDSMKIKLKRPLRFLKLIDMKPVFRNDDDRISRLVSRFQRLKFMSVASPLAVDRITLDVTVKTLDRVQAAVMKRLSEIEFRASQFSFFPAYPFRLHLG